MRQQLNMIDCISAGRSHFTMHQPLKRLSRRWKFLAESFLPSSVALFHDPAPSMGPGFPGSSEPRLSEHDRAHWFNACTHPNHSVEAHTKSRHTKKSPKSEETSK